MKLQVNPAFSGQPSRSSFQKGIYWRDLHRLWSESSNNLSSDRKAKDMVAVQSVRLDASSHGPAREHQEITRELLVFSLHWAPGEMGSNNSKEMPSGRIGELASESEGKQAKGKGFLLPCPFMGAAPKDVAQV